MRNLLTALILTFWTAQLPGTAVATPNVGMVQACYDDWWGYWGACEYWYHQSEMTPADEDDRTICHREGTNLLRRCLCRAGMCAGRPLGTIVETRIDDVPVSEVGAVVQPNLSVSVRIDVSAPNDPAERAGFILWGPDGPTNLGQGRRSGTGWVIETGPLNLRTPHLLYARIQSGRGSVYYSDPVVVVPGTSDRVSWGMLKQRY